MQLDDECLSEASRWMSHVRSVVLSNNEFTAAGVRALAKSLRKQDMGKLRSLALKSCRMDSDCLYELADILPHLESAVLSYNNFSGQEGVRRLADRLTSGGGGTVRLKHLEMRHCRLIDGGKKALGDAGKKAGVEVKLW